MARRNYYKAWPEEAGTPFLNIVNSQSILLGMIDDTVKDGIIEAGGVTEYNVSVFEIMIPKIIRRTQKIQVECQDICSLLEEERRGRLPKWYTTTMDINAKAMTIIQILEEEAIPALGRNEMPYLKIVFKCLTKYISDIKKLLDINPWRPGLRVWEDAVREALKD